MVTTRRVLAWCGRNFLAGIVVLAVIVGLRSALQFASQAETPPPCPFCGRPMNVVDAGRQMICSTPECPGNQLKALPWPE